MSLDPGVRKWSDSSELFKNKSSNILFNLFQMGFVQLCV